MEPGLHSPFVPVNCCAIPSELVESTLFGHVKGAFTGREDLYFRIAGYTIPVPPLRDRPGDIPLLAQHFAESLAEDIGIASPGISAEAMAALQRHPFGGNIRELRNIVQAGLVECEGTEIQPNHLRFIRLMGAESAPPLSPTTPAAAAADPPSTLNLAEL